MPDPITGEGFDAPSPEVAYMGAPDPVEESARLMQMASEMTTEAAAATARGETFELDEEVARLYLLRRAALADRLSLAHPDNGQFVTDAARLAHELADHDHEHQSHGGPIGPRAIEWDPSHRPYVRQEYDHWGW
ncbi:hypothetical protein [Streptomyces sp. NBC_01304]|uniref:hypothetical protein n=1 Tax=Streptomyces sp. NBC_01304 TaxID=2903818 RepID=UPI002E107F9C|nr:hypothetical protein OG430_49360 [Streptomyces sp. NBC_01304]